MDTRRRWIRYDTFKLAAALILLALLVFLLLRGPAAVVESRAAAGTPIPPANTAALPSSTPPASAAQAVSLPTATLMPSPTAELPTAAPMPSPTIAPAAAQPALTLTPETATPAPAAQAEAAGCPLAQPSRLAVGQAALVTTKLNMRSEAGMDRPVIRVSLPNSKLDIIGGPVCIPYQNGAYLWWNVRSADGLTGWSAEASLSSSFYFLQPIP